MEKDVQTAQIETSRQMSADRAPEHHEDIDRANLAPVYENEEEEPEIHFRTWMALIAMWLINFAQVIALFGPTSVLSYIGRSLNGVPEQTWVPNALSLVAAVIGPLFSSASDVFQARKSILLGACVAGFVGCAVAAGSKNIGRLIGSSVVIGIGYASVPLGYSVPSEILPRKWRPLAQAWINMAAGLATLCGPLMMGALVKRDPVDGWRPYYVCIPRPRKSRKKGLTQIQWFQMGLWGVAALAIFFGYRPPRRQSVVSDLSIWQQLRKLDLPGFALLTVGLTLFLTGMSLGGGLYSWTNARTLSTLVIGIVVCIAFGLYEWKGTSTGMIHHGLFSLGSRYARTFTLCCALFAVEAALIFAFVIFYPVLTSTLYETDPFLINLRGEAYWIAALICSPIWAWGSSYFRTIKLPMFLGFLVYLGGTIGFATLQPDQSLNSLLFASLSGIGFGAPMVLILAGVQLSTPHSLIATATAVAVSSRAVFATIFTAIYSAILNNSLPGKVASMVPPALIGAGLPPDSIAAFITALNAQDPAAFAAVPGVTPTIIGVGVAAFKQAFADTVRLIYIIAAAFCLLATLGVLFIDPMKDGMNYRVEAPVEDLHAKKLLYVDGEDKA